MISDDPLFEKILFVFSDFLEQLHPAIGIPLWCLWVVLTLPIVVVLMLAAMFHEMYEEWGT